MTIYPRKTGRTTLLRKKSKNNRRTQDTVRKSLRVETLEKGELFAADTIVGIVTGTWWHVDNNNPAPQFGPDFRSHPNTVSFGLSGDQPVLGDWNGDGTNTPGIFRNGTWVLDIEGNGFDTTDRILSFGLTKSRRTRMIIRILQSQEIQLAA